MYRGLRRLAEDPVETASAIRKWGRPRKDEKQVAGYNATIVFETAILVVLVVLFPASSEEVTAIV
jgi:hypothetical protein